MSAPKKSKAKKPHKSEKQEDVVTRKPKSISSNFAEEVLKSMISQIKIEEKNAIEVFCTALINEKILKFNEQFKVRMDNIEDDIQSIRNEVTMAKYNEKESTIQPIDSKLESILLNTENLITNLLVDINKQNKVIEVQSLEMLDLRKIVGNNVKKNNTKNNVDIFSGINTMESKIRKLEIEEIRVSDTKFCHKDIILLESKILKLQEKMNEYEKQNNNKDFYKLHNKVNDLSVAQIRLKDKMIHVNAKNINTSKSLISGLNDMQEITVDLISWSDQIYTSFGIVSEKLFLSKNICPILESKFNLNNNSSDLNKANKIDEKRYEEFCELLSPISKNIF